jgi:hypothetical protein
MPYHIARRYSSTERPPAIFWISFDPVTRKWFAFSEDTEVILSEHKTKGEAYGACRRYEAAAWRRMVARPLADLVHRSI